MAVGPRRGVRIGFRARGPEKAERSRPLSGRWQGGCRTGEQSLRGGHVGTGERRADARIKTLRRKLGDDAAKPAFIRNERRIGYRMPRPRDP